VVGKRAGGGRGLRHQRHTAGATTQLRRPGPFADQPRQQQTPFQAAERLRQRQRFARQLPRSRFGERDFVLVDVADRHDARQDRGVARQHIEERVAGQPAGPARRQKQGGLRQRQRIAQSGKAELAAGQRLDQRRQERRRRRYGENAWSHG